MMNDILKKQIELLPDQPMLMMKSSILAKQKI